MCVEWDRRMSGKRAMTVVSLFALGCTLFVVTQHLRIRYLRSSIRILTSGVSSAAQPKVAGVTESLGLREAALSREKAEIERLTKLRNQLTSQVVQLEQMRVENEKLRAELAHPRIAGMSSDETETLAKARDKAISVQCANNLKQFGLAVRVWALDNEDRFPPDIVCMSNELSTPKILVCPADYSRQVATDWSTFTPANCSYEHLAPAGSDDEPLRVLSRCRIHGHVGLCDGSVQMQVALNHPDYFVFRDGKLYMERPIVPEFVPSQQSDSEGITPEQ